MAIQVVIYSLGETSIMLVWCLEKRYVIAKLLLNLVLSFSEHSKQHTLEILPTLVLHVVCVVV